MARRDRELDEAIDQETMITHLGGVMGIDLEVDSLDQPISELQAEGARSLLDWVRAAVPNRVPTVRDIGLLASRSSRVSGTPQRIADQLEQWQAAGIDGINVINATIPGSYVEFIDEVMPVLRARGLARAGYTPGTLRHKLFGYDRLPASHPAACYRNAFARA